MIAPEVLDSLGKRDVIINIFHASNPYDNEALLLEAPKILNINLAWELKPCYGYSLVKGLQKSISSSSGSCAPAKVEHVYVDILVISQSPP